MIKTKHVKKELAEIILPVMEHIAKYGTDQYTPEVVYQHNGIEYKAVCEVNEAREVLTVTLHDYYGCYPKFEAPLGQLVHLIPENHAKRFANENPHLVTYAYRLLKKMH